MSNTRLQLLKEQDPVLMPLLVGSLDSSRVHGHLDATARDENRGVDDVVVRTTASTMKKPP